MLMLGSVRPYTGHLMTTPFILSRQLSLSSPLVTKLTFMKDTGSSDLWTLSDACLSGCTDGKKQRNEVREYLPDLIEH